MNIANILEYNAKHKGSNIALIHDTEPEPKTLRYEELNERSNRVANHWLSTNISKEDRVAILVHNCNQYFECLFAAAKIGAILVPLNIRLGPGEVGYILSHCEPKSVVYNHEYEDVLVRATEEHYICEEYLCTDPTNWLKAKEYEQVLSDSSSSDPEVESPDIDDIFMIMYTSGTTAFPKGAMLSNGNLLWNSLSYVLQWSYSEEDVNLCVAPSFHIGGLGAMVFSNLHVGGKVVLHEKFDPKRALRAMEQYRVTNSHLLKVFFDPILQEDLSQYNLESVRLVMASVAPIEEKYLRKWMNHCPGVVMFGMGMTESCSAYAWTLDSQDLFDKPGTLGQPIIHTDVKLVDDNGNEVKVGQPGEIILRGPNVFKGYYKSEEENKAAFRDGWFYTGDTAYADEDGFLFFVDRKKDMIKSGGENISSLEVEQMLCRHPKIEDVAVVGVKDDRWIEAVKAYVVVKPGSELTMNEITDFCKKTLAGFKTPKYVEFIEFIPRTAIGKIQKNILRRKG